MPPKVGFEAGTVEKASVVADTVEEAPVVVGTVVKPSVVVGTVMKPSVVVGTVEEPTVVGKIGEQRRCLRQMVNSSVVDPNVIVVSVPGVNVVSVVPGVNVVGCFLRILSWLIWISTALVSIWTCLSMISSVLFAIFSELSATPFMLDMIL